MANQPYVEFLRTTLDPLVAEISENMSINSDPTLALFKKDTIPSGEVSDEGYIDLWQSNAKPAIHVGDRFEYVVGDNKEYTGRIKTKKITEAIQITKDEYLKMEKSGGKVTNKIKKKIEGQMRKNEAYKMIELKKWLFGGISASLMRYDSEFISPLTKSAGATLADPDDLNANTTLDNTAIIWSGGSQTANNCVAFANAVRVILTKVDSESDMEIPIGTIYWFVTPIFYAILETNKDILNSTSGQRSSNNYITDLAALGITVKKENQGGSYTYATTNAHTSMIVIDPEQDFEIDLITNEESDGWSEWKEMAVIDSGTTRFVYGKFKEIEFTMISVVYESSSVLYKKCLQTSTTPYTA